MKNAVIARLLGGGHSNLSSLSGIWQAGKYAFTLAEVLITLGIIGIVAAMTLPALIQKNNSIALETAFKKSYSNLYNAYMMVIAEEVPGFCNKSIRFLSFRAC